jgi:hypothetical protein
VKSAIVYEHNEKIIVHSSSTTTMGVGLLTPPVVAVDKSAPSRIGQALRECLDASKGDVAHPTDFRNLFAPVLALACAKSYGAFARAAKCVKAEMDGETITLVPSENLGPKGGFEALPADVTITLQSDQELGLAVLRSLALSK